MNLHCSDVELLSKNFMKQTFFANKKCVEEYSLVKKNVRILRRTELACRLITPIRIGEVKWCRKMSDKVNDKPLSDSDTFNGK